jgi:hypothetical protein
MQLPERFGNVVSSITKNHQFDSNGSKQPWINTAGHPSIGHKEAVDSEVRTWLVGKTNKQKKATRPPPKQMRLNGLALNALTRATDALK